MEPDPDRGKLGSSRRSLRRAPCFRSRRRTLLRLISNFVASSLAIGAPPGPATGRGSIFVATLRWEYRVTPASSTMRFACVSDPGEYRDLLRDQATTSAWYFDQSAPMAAASREAFELVQLTVNGKARTIRRTERKDAQLYTASLGTTRSPARSPHGPPARQAAARPRLGGAAQGEPASTSQVSKLWREVIRGEDRDGAGLGLEPDIERSRRAGDGRSCLGGK